MQRNSESFFFLVDHEGNRRVPRTISAKDGRFGFAIHPKGKGNDASAADYCDDNKRMVQAVVLEGLGVRCFTADGTKRGQVNTLGLSGKAIRGYWLAPQFHEWVRGAEQPPLADADLTAPRQTSVARIPRVRRVNEMPREVHKPVSVSASQVESSELGRYVSKNAFQFRDECSHFCELCGTEGTTGLEAGPFDLDALTIAREGERQLRFAPLGNRPASPRIALVGITPGGQIARFAGNLATMNVAAAAKEAAFHGAQAAIKPLLAAHGLAEHLGVSLMGDLNDSPAVLTTSVVKCCLMVEGNSYQFAAPDIEKSSAAHHCATRRLFDELTRYPTLRVVLVFGFPAWSALHALRLDGTPIIERLRRSGRHVLQLPHFAQNQQQRALYCCAPGEEAVLIGDKPHYEGYADKALVMRRATLDFIASQPFESRV